MKTTRSFVQGNNAQAALNEQQIVLAAEICTEPVDCSSLGPMITATLRELERAGIAATPEVAAADAGFCNERQMDELAGDGIPILIPPDSRTRKGERPGWTGGRYSWMRRLLATDHGSELDRKRAQSIEPVGAVKVRSPTGGGRWTGTPGSTGRRTSTTCRSPGAGREGAKKADRGIQAPRFD